MALEKSTVVIIFLFALVNCCVAKTSWSIFQSIITGNTSKLLVQLSQLSSLQFRYLATLVQLLVLHHVRFEILYIATSLVLSQMKKQYKCGCRRYAFRYTVRLGNILIHRAQHLSQKIRKLRGGRQKTFYYMWKLQVKQ